MTATRITRCSFCGMTSVEAWLLIAGPYPVAICQSCVLQCMALIGQRLETTDDRGEDLIWLDEARDVEGRRLHDDVARVVAALSEHLDRDPDDP